MSTYNETLTRLFRYLESEDLQISQRTIYEIYVRLYVWKDSVLLSTIQNTCGMYDPVSITSTVGQCRVF